MPDAFLSRKIVDFFQQKYTLDSAAVSIFVEWTNTVFVNSTNITTNIETAVLSSVDLLHSPTITITVDILMINRKSSSRITIVMITVDLSRVKTPFLLPATLRGSCLVMKSAKFQIISPKSYPFQTTLLINHTVCRR